MKTSSVARMPPPMVSLIGSRYVVHRLAEYFGVSVQPLAAIGVVLRIQHAVEIREIREHLPRAR